MNTLSKFSLNRLLTWILSFVLIVLWLGFQGISKATPMEYNYWIYAINNENEVVATLLENADHKYQLDINIDPESSIPGVRCSENGLVLLLTIQNQNNKSLWTFFIDSGIRYELATFPPETSIPYGDISKDGQWVIFYGNVNSITASWLMSSDGKSSRAIGSMLEGSHARAPTFSWDSQSVAFVYGPQRILYIEDIVSGSVKQISSTSLGPVWNPHFLPNNHEIYAMITENRQTMSLYKININTLTAKKCWNTLEAVVGALPSQNNSMCALMTVSLDGKTWKIWGMDAENNEPRLIATQARTANSFSLQLSMDGQWLLYRCDGQPIRLAKMDGNLDKSLHEFIGFKKVTFATFYTQNPLSPVLKGTNVNQQCNLVEWQYLHISTFPLKEFQLFRKNFFNEDSWILLTHLNPNESSYEDFVPSEEDKAHLYRIRAIDIEGNSSLWSNEILMDKIPPQLEVLSPAPKTWLNSISNYLSGKVHDTESGINSLLCNGQKVEIDAEGNFHFPISLVEGKNPFLLIAKDYSGNYIEMLHEVWLDTQSPEISLAKFTDGMELLSGNYQLTGLVKDLQAGISEFTINNKEALLDESGFFSSPVTVFKGVNHYLLKAIDHAGNTTIKEIALMGIDPVYIQCWIGKTDIRVNGKVNYIDAAPFIHESSHRTMVPIRFIVEPIDSSIAYDPATQIITIERYRTKLLCQIGKNTAIVNGLEKPIDESDPSLYPMIIKQRTYLPLRFVAENLGFRVQWNALDQQIDLVFPHI